jgi:hypothetical protein
VGDIGPNLVDVVALASLGFAAWSGFRAGFVAATYSLASWVLATAAAIAFKGPATNVVEAVARLPKPLAATVALVVVIVVVKALFSTAGHLATRPLVAFIRRSPLTAADRILGTLPATDPLALHRRVGRPRHRSAPVRQRGACCGRNEPHRRHRQRTGRGVPTTDRAVHRAARGDRDSLSPRSARTRPSISIFPMGSSARRTRSPSGSSSIL